jgi:hypothetical protein
VKEFQVFNNLEPTGKLNKETRDLMKEDRCGNPDVECGEQLSLRCIALSVGVRMIHGFPQISLEFISKTWVGVNGEIKNVMKDINIRPNYLNQKSE